MIGRWRPTSVSRTHAVVTGPESTSLKSRHGSGDTLAANRDRIIAEVDTPPSWRRTRRAGSDLPAALSRSGGRPLRPRLGGVENDAGAGARPELP
jgi:hypothetical protein